MRLKGMIAALVASAMLLAPLPALAAGVAISKNQPAVGTLTSRLNTTHTVYVQPLTFKQSFNLAHYRKVTSEVTKFWAHEVPGLKLKFILKTPKKTTKATACGRAAAWKYASKVSGIAPKSLKTHLMAWGIGCGTFGLAEVGGSYGFSGAEPDYNNDLFYDMSSSVMAHELGHNFGFDHSTGLNCKSSTGKRVPLSTNCTEIEYGDDNDIMGSGTITDGSARLSGFYKMRVKTPSVLKKVPSTGGKVVVVSTRSKGYQGAVVQSSIGPIIFDFEGGRYELTGKKTLGVSAHVQLKNANQSQLSFPNDAGVIEDANSLLTLGKSWNIAGTTLRVVVSAVTSTSATLTFARQTDAPTVVAPMLIANTCVVDGPCTVGWQGGSSSSGISSYRLEVNGVLGEPLPATTSASAVAADPNTPGAVVVRVQLNTKDGYSVWSEPMTYTFDVTPSVDFYSNGTLIGTYSPGDTVTVRFKRGQVISWRFVEAGDATERTWLVSGITNVRTNSIWDTTTVPLGDGSWTVPDSMFYKSTGTRVYYQTSVFIGGGSLNFTLVINGS